MATEPNEWEVVGQSPQPGKLPTLPQSSNRGEWEPVGSISSPTPAPPIESIAKRYQDAVKTPSQSPYPYQISEKSISSSPEFTTPNSADQIHEAVRQSSPISKAWDALNYPLVNLIPEGVRKNPIVQGASRIADIATGKGIASEAAKLIGGKSGEGVSAGIDSMADSMTSPIGIATLGMGTLPKVAQRAISLAFSAQMAKQVPGIARQLGEEFARPEGQRDEKKIAELITEAAGQVGFSAIGAAHGLSPSARINTKVPVEWREIKPTPPKGDQNAPEIRPQQQGGVPEYPGTEAQRLPAETVGGNRPAQSGEGLQADQTKEVGDAARLSQLKKLSETRMLTKEESADLVKLQTKSSAANSREAFERVQRQSKQSEPVNTFENAVESPEFKGGNKLSTATGLGTKSISDLDGLLSLQQKFKDNLSDQGLRGQLARESIEVATDTGSWAEADIKPPFTKLGERPLDWRKNPEVKDWLIKNADKLWPKPKGMDVENPNRVAFEKALKEEGRGTPSDREQRAREREQASAVDAAAERQAEASQSAKPEVSSVNDWENPIQNKFTVEMEKMGNSLELPRKKDRSVNPKSLTDKGSTYPTFVSKDGNVKLAIGRTALFERDGNVWKGDPSEPVQDGFVLEIISTDPSVRGMGKASAMMKDVINAADASGAKLYGEVAPVKTLTKRGQKALTRQQLFKWYESLGFKKVGVSLIERDPISKQNPEPAAAGPGAAVPEDVGAKAELAQLNDSLKTLAEQNPGRPELNRSYTLGEKLSRWKEPVLKSISGLKAAAQKAKIDLQRPSVWNDFKQALGERQLSLAESAKNGQAFQQTAYKAVPKLLDREAISDWIDNGGDRQALLRAIAETSQKFEPGYQRALSLPPELQTVARNAQNYFESRLQDAIDAGVLEDGIENYIHRIYEKDSPWKQGVIAELRSGVFTGKPSLAKNRVFQYDFEAEKAGYSPVKDFVRRIVEYDLALNKAIADRKFVKETMDWEMPDKKPALQFIGAASKTTGEGADAAYLIRPKSRPGAKEDRYVTADGRPYVAFDHPALRKWKWVEEDASGSPIMIQGEALVHPDALKWINGVFGQSKVRQYKVGRALLSAGSTIKQTMLDLSGFHPVQITVHGWEHRADVPLTRWTANLTGRDFQEINLDDPVQRDLVSHGLTVVDPYHVEMFGEGLSGAGSSLLRHLPFGVGERLQAYNKWLFQDYIPRLKMSMAKHALERNRSAYSKDLKTGKMTEDELLHMTANQANAAFGELNYEMLGRSKTMQDMLRIGLLAPDFLEARARFAAQAGKPFVGGYGREQLTALGLGAATLYVTARIMNKLINGQWHTEPEHAFDVLHNGRAYSLRTVQGDIIHAIFNPRSFIYTRLNPVTTRTAFEAMTGRDQFGRPRTPVDQIKDFASTIVPISLRGVVRPGEQKLWESALNAFGVTERRATATDHLFKIVDDFKKKHGVTEPGEFIYDPDKDPYRAIKIALLFGSPRDAAQEIKLTLDKKLVDFEHMGAYFDQFGTRPFTGSKALENEFWKSLTEDQKQTYQEALKERANMRANAREAFKLYRHDFAGKP